MDYQKRPNPITGLNLLDRGLRELERLVPQVILQTASYHFRGYEKHGTGVDISYGHDRLKDIVEKEWWPRLVERAISTNAIVTRDFKDGGVQRLATPNFLEAYVTMYVRTAVNLRNLVAVMNMAEMNRGFGTFLLDANLPGGGRIKRALNMLDQLGHVPIPEFFFRRAVSLAGVYMSGVGEPITLRFIVNEVKIKRAAGGDLGAQEPGRLADLTNFGDYYQGGVARHDWAEAILADAKWCINTLLGLRGGTEYGTWNEDVVKVHDIWEILGIQGQPLPTPLQDPLDNKFEYLSLVNDRPWMWPEERAVGRDNYIFTNHVTGDEDTCIREFGGDPPDLWYAGFGTWAMTKVTPSAREKVASNASFILYGEVLPFTTTGTDTTTGDALVGGTDRLQPWYIWYNEKSGWHEGIQTCDDVILKDAGVGSEAPTLDPLFNRNVNIMKASRALYEATPVGKYPVNRPYMMDLVEQNLDDYSNGFLMTMSGAIDIPEN